MEPEAKEVMQALTTLREDIEGKLSTALTVEEKARLEKVLDSQEAVSQKAFLASERADNLETQIKELTEGIEKSRTDGETKSAEYQAQLDELTGALAMKTATDAEGKDYKEGEEYKNLTAWIQRPDLITPEQKATLRTDQDNAAGFLVPAQLDSILLKEIVELDSLRSLARTRTIGVKTLDMPVRNGIPAATYEGEAGSASESLSNYRMVSVTPFRQTVQVPVTMDMLMNGGFDIEGEIRGDVAESFALGEGQGFVVGTGFKQPEGFTTNTDVIATAAAGTDLSAVDADGSDAEFADAIIAMPGEVKTGYSGAYGFTRRSIARIRQLRDGNGAFLWMPSIGMASSNPNTINGFPYVELPSLADFDGATGADIGVFADFARGYSIVDRVGVSVVRDEVTAAAQAIIKLTFHRWNTGIVTIPEAYKLMQAA